MRVLLVFLSILSAAPAWANAERDFVSSCMESFHASQPEGDQAVTRKICECAGPETKRQGATDRAIRRETDAIRKDPKHKIADPHVLAALQYCAIETLHQAYD